MIGLMVRKLARRGLSNTQVRLYLAGWHVGAANPNLPVEQG